MNYREVRHSAKGGVTMYIDHSDWAKASTTSKKRAFKSTQSKKMLEDDGEDFS